ncbi:MAG: DUF2818 family protein [Variovorax sp.]
MSQTASVWLVLLLAIAAANLPFLSERLFGVVPLVTRRKPLAWRFAELLVLYFIVGGVGLLFEARSGQLAAQGWEFYAVTGTLFVVLAFPGFVWCYLLKRRRHVT